MSVLKIITFPESVLRRKSIPVELLKHEDKVLLDNMLETMRASQGVGLAAPQVGILRRIIVLDAGEGVLQLVNPVITAKSGSEVSEEGCLSMPGTMVRVKRAKRITYKALDREGKPVEGKAEGLPARVIQHEIDHLDGRLIIDHLNPIKRFFFKIKYHKAC